MIPIHGFMSTVGSSRGQGLWFRFSGQLRKYQSEAVRQGPKDDMVDLGATWHQRSVLHLWSSKRWLPSGHQISSTLKSPTRRFRWENHLKVVDFTLPCLITRLFFHWVKSSSFTFWRMGLGKKTTKDCQTWMEKIAKVVDRIRQWPKREPDPSVKWWHFVLCKPCQWWRVSPYESPWVLASFRWFCLAKTRFQVEIKPPCLLVTCPLLL